jgi:hypothetical protein
LFSNSVYLEWNFGNLQAVIVIGPAEFWHHEILWYIINACVIMHNIIIKNEHRKVWTMASTPWWDSRCSHEDVETESALLEVYHNIQDSDVHEDFQKDLIEKWWTWNGQQNH